MAVFLINDKNVGLCLTSSHTTTLWPSFAFPLTLKPQRNSHAISLHYNRPLKNEFNSDDDDDDDDDDDGFV